MTLMLRIMNSTMVSHCSLWVDLVCDLSSARLSLIDWRLCDVWTFERWSPLPLLSNVIPFLLFIDISPVVSPKVHRRRCCSMWELEDKFFQKSVRCWESLPSPSDVGVHITKNLSRPMVVGELPWLKITTIVVLAPFVNIPVEGRTRNFSGAVVLI